MRVDPVTVRIEQRVPYGIMWIAGVRQVDLAQHCLRAFGRSDRPPLDLRKRRQIVRLSPISPPLAWYLCALPVPWDWNANAHLAFAHEPGYEWEGDALVPGLHAELWNARPIFGWGEHTIPADEPLRRSSRHRTCRNWQFAWWLHLNRGAPNLPTPPAQPSPPSGQLRLL
jgi:hypothetical protein